MATMKLALLTMAFVSAAAAMGETTEQQPNEYILLFPESKSITLSPDPDYLSLTNDSRDYGKFECATRAGVLPLWIINGVSAASIKMEPGFENVSYSIYPILENTTFTLLYIPGSEDTNNSMIRCAAIVDRKVVAYSDAVNFTVFCNENCTATDGLYTSTTGISSPLPTDKGSMTTAIPPHLIAGICGMVLLGLLLVAVSIVLVVVLCIWTRRRRKERIGQQNRPGENNVYWSAGNRNLLEESINSQDLKSPTIKQT